MKPNFANAYSDCGLICEEKNHHEKALGYYETAYALDPNNLNVLQNLVELEEKLEKFEDAIEHYNVMLEHKDADSVKVYVELAKLQKKIGNVDGALNSCGNAIKIGLQDLECMEINELFGSSLLEKNNKKAALIFFLKAVGVDPQSAECHTTIGSIHKDCGNFTDAVVSYNMALNIIPNFPDAYCNLVHCSLLTCDWSDYENRILKLKEIVAEQISNDQVPSILPHYSLLFNFSPETFKKIASAYAKQCIDKANLVKKATLDHVNQRFLSNGRIRVGYVSSNFGNHPITQLMQSILNSHDRNKVEVFCYSLSPDDGSSSPYV